MFVTLNNSLFTSLSRLGSVSDDQLSNVSLISSTDIACHGALPVQHC